MANTVPIDHVRPVVLHLYGSRVSKYYEGVSKYYAQHCYGVVVDQGTYRHVLARVHLDGSWSFPSDFSDTAQNSAEKVSMADAMRIIAQIQPYAVNPVMFCLPGMTTYRAIFDALAVPLIGCGPDTMAISTDKAKSRAIVAAAGVRVAEAELLRRGDRPKMGPPFILKPCREDNSVGITLYRGLEGEDLEEALDNAFRYDNEVICERYIELGRELRCAVLERPDGSFEMLPVLEYYLSDASPIRTSAHKIVTDKRGLPTTLAQGGRKCPADGIDRVLLEKLRDLCERSHEALGCRDYSLYDVRVDPQGEPYFLEACLYCSFAPKSVIVGMAKAQGKSHQDLFEDMVEKAARRRHRFKAGCGESGESSGSQMFGMKVASK